MLEKKKLNETPNSNNLTNSSKSSKSPAPAHDLLKDKLNLKGNASSSFKSSNNQKPLGLGNDLSTNRSNNNNNNVNGNKISSILNSNTNNLISQSI